MINYKLEQALRKMFREGDISNVPSNWSEDDFVDYLASYGRALTKSSGSTEYSSWTEAFKRMSKQFDELANLIEKRGIKLLTKREARKLAHELGKAVEDEEEEEEEEKKYYSIFSKEEEALFRTAKDAKRTDLGSYPKRTFTESRSEEVKEEARERVRDWAHEYGMKAVDYPFHHVEEKAEGIPQKKPYQEEDEEQEKKKRLPEKKRPFYMEREDDSEEKEKGFKEMAEENLAREGKEPKYKKPDKYPKKEKQPEKYPYKKNPRRKRIKNPSKIIPKRIWRSLLVLYLELEDLVQLV